MNEELENWTAILEAEWFEPNGFLFKARQGVFEVTQGMNFISMLEGMKPPQNATTIDRRFVALLWYVPLFLHWQRERIAEKGGNVPAFIQLINRVHAVVEEILGVP